jgi:hypothetical protein
MSDIASQEFYENPLFTLLVQLFRDKAPEWKLMNAMYPDESKVYSEWGDGDGKAVIQIARMASPEQASSHLQMFAWHIPLSPSSLTDMQRNPAQFQLPQPVMPDTELPNLGDENHAWSRYDERGSSLIKLRAGSLFVQVDGSSFAVAERLARLVAEQLRAA